MYKKLREIFSWFQQKAIRRMSLKNVLNEYYYRMDSSGTQSRQEHVINDRLSSIGKRPLMTGSWR